MKRRTRLGRIPSMKQEPTDDTLGALFGPHMHDSSQEVLALLRKLEWRGDNVNHHGYRGFCPSCGNDQATGHRTDCELNKVLTGPGPRIAGHLVEQNKRLARELAEAQKQNAALQEHNTKEVERRRAAEREVASLNATLEGYRAESKSTKDMLIGRDRRIAELGHDLREANVCLDANRREVSKLSALHREHLDRGRRLQGKLSEVLKRENLTKLDLADVLTWAKEMHQMARHGLTILAGHLGIYSSPVYPDPASLYSELFKLMSTGPAARVALHPLTKTAEKAKST